MNLIEHWGSGIPRIIDKVKASGLQEPEFIGGEVDLRINIYRGQVDGTVDLNNAIKVPDTIDKMPDSDNKVPDKTETVPDTTEKMPDSEQEQQIYKYVLENGSITTAETVEILDVKHRRARAVLLNMVKDGYLRKEGAARSTIYVKIRKEDNATWFIVFTKFSQIISTRLLTWLIDGAIYMLYEV